MAAVSLVVLTTACTPTDKEPPLVWSLAGHVVMGTVLEIRIGADDQATADELVEAAFATARHWDDVLTTWRDSGELARFNAAAGNWEQPSDDLESALVKMIALSAATDGVFDPAVGPLVRSAASGSGASLQQLPLADTNTQSLRIATALTRGPSQWRLAEGSSLDSGGIGKGIALDAIAETVGARARSFYFDFGGSSQLVSGSPRTDETGWRIAVAGTTPGIVHGIATINSGSLSTSRALAADDPAGTIIDPRTMEPVAPPRLATVWAADATTAEAWSTALVVLGINGLDAARRAGVEAIVEADGILRKTPAFPLTPSK